MLQLIFGKASTGKTTHIHNEIKNSECENIILLVPEQYTFETEKQMLNLLGNGFMNKVNVLSFSRMCEAVGQLYGGISGLKTTDSQRLILMSRAVKTVGSRLVLFKKYIKSPDFVRQVTDIISEFKQAGVSDRDLMNVTESLEDSGLKNKALEICEIYASYNKLLEETYIDPLDDLERLYNQVLNTDFFNDKTIYIDAFKGFTGLQIKLIKLMITKCKKVTLTFCADGPEDNEQGVGVFSNIKKTANGILKFAKDNHIEVLKPIILDKSYFKFDDIKSLEKLIGGREKQEKTVSEHINIYTAQNPLEEIEYAFKCIHRLVRKENFKFSDFVIIARNIENYERLIESSSEKYQVPCYLDKRRSLVYSPLTRFIIAALKAAKKLSTESILVYIKTGLLGLDDFEIAMLEEYVYTWDISGDDWLKKWDMDPDGIIRGEFKAEKNVLKERLDSINSLREKVVVPLLGLKKSFGGNAEEISKAVFNLLKVLNADKKIKEYCLELEKNNLFDDADFISESWDKTMEALDSIVRCYGPAEITVDEYIGTLELAFSETTIGSIPRTLDEVSCGSADRIRTSAPKITFVIGLNMGEFPATVAQSGLLLKADRICLKASGLDISDRFNSFAVEENFLVYSALCSSKERVYISNHKFSIDGTECEPSGIFTKISETFSNFTNNDPTYILPETAPEAFSYLALNNNKNSRLLCDIRELLNKIPSFEKRITAMENSKNQSVHRLSKETCKKLFGNDIYLSASRVENYNGCAFSYFCRYILKISPPKKAELDSLQRGTIVHFIMENVLKNLGADIKNAADEEINELINKYMKLYLEEIEGFEYLKKPRFEFLYNMIAKMSFAVLLHIRDEFKVCSFVPENFELEISAQGDLPLLKIKFADNKTVNINGKIDRVDKLSGVSGENYIRIVDYKTGSKEFHLPDILYGLNMQMLIYLYAIKVLGKDLYGEVSPAGILYKPSKRNVRSEDEQGSTGFAMNGMLVNNDEILNGMDKTNSGNFAPKNTGKERKSNPIISKEDFDTVLDFTKLQISKTAEKITNGIYDVNPIEGSGYSACKYCEFSSVCQKESNDEIFHIEPLSTGKTIEKMKEELGNV